MTPAAAPGSCSPETDVGNAFAVPLARLDASIEREILRLRARYQLSLDEFRGLYVSDEQVDALIAGAGQLTAGGLDSAREPLTAGMQDASPRWRQLAATFALSPLDEDLLFIAAAPELDLKYETLYGYLNNDVTRKWPTAALAVRLLDGMTGTGDVVQALAPRAPLHAHRLLRRIDQPAGQPALLNAGYALEACLAHWLHGHSASAALDGGGVSWLTHRGRPMVDGDRSNVRAASIVRLLAGSGTRVMPVVALIGEAGSGRWTTAVAVAAAADRPLAHLDLRVASHDESTFAATLDRLRVVITLEPAVVLIEGFDATGDDETRSKRRDAKIARAIAQWPGSALVMFKASADERWRACAGRRTIEVACQVDRFADRVIQWQQAARLETVEVAEADLRDLAGRFALTPGHARAAVATARDLATMNGVDTVDAVYIAEAARRGSDQALDRLAAKVEHAHEWTDLVLPPTTLRRLRELAAAIRHRHVVYGEWGFKARIVTGAGINALFAGGSGTGKTMAAGVVARELGLDLYKVDLSAIVSKYIGETEKNLDRIFRAARAANAIVFLDEAEALLGKRSEVKDAHDRYANIEVAYLLQKLEGDAIVILATNLKRNIDDAFGRRMHYVVDFPRPTDAERERIWRGMFPPQSPRATDIDFAFLARQFDLAGGDIRNVVLDAAFLAAQNGRVIGMRAIVEALARQLTKQGKTPTSLEFRQYQELLSTATDVRDGS
jgi:hypothetical protein